MVSRKKPIKVVVSGYFNPVHLGHLRMFEQAKKLGDKLVVIVNNDEQVRLKGNVPFMNEKDRMRIVKLFKPVDEVFLSVDKEKIGKEVPICKSLAKLKPDIFANGGDRASTKEIPETKICRRLGIKMVFGVGGKKTISSSALIKSAAENHLKNSAVIRPWGSYTVLLEAPGYKIKKFIVRPGHSQSLQMHKHRSEHWIVVSGQAQIQRGEKKFNLKTNQSTFIPKKTKHRVANAKKSLLEIIEVQNGKYLGEDDIVRFKDKYGRA